MDEKRYADEYDHTSFPMASPVLVRQQRTGLVRDHDLRFDRSNVPVNEKVEHRPPLEIQAELRAIELEILQGIEELEELLR